MIIHEHITKEIIGAAIRIHRALGPGLLESAYEEFLAHELSTAGLRVERQVYLPLNYLGLAVNHGYRLDMLVEDLVIVEIKSVDRLVAIHEAQLLTYMRLARKSLGLVINFNVTRLKDGIMRRVLTEQGDL